MKTTLSPQQRQHIASIIRAARIVFPHVWLEPIEIWHARIRSICP